jgi:alkanesulfonate monooxygenase
LSRKSIRISFVLQSSLACHKKLNVIAAQLPCLWNPAIAAKQITNIDHYTNGGISVDVVSGCLKTEFTSICQWGFEQAERYWLVPRLASHLPPLIRSPSLRRSGEFIECLWGIWTEEKFTYKSDFCQFHDYPLSPKPLDFPSRPYPLIFQSGNWIDARENGSNASDYYFINAN